jgi:hypothetical protein
VSIGLLLRNVTQVRGFDRKITETAGHVYSVINTEKTFSEQTLTM